MNLECSDCLVDHYQKESLPFSNTKHSFVHAELNAVLSTNANLEGATIYIYREDNNGNLCCCKPCPACEFVLRQVGITTVYYTDYNKFIRADLI